MTDTKKEEVTPDELMGVFRGSSLKAIIIFTVVVHAVLLLGTSLPAILKSAAGKDASKMTEDERMVIAVREATESLRQIAEENGLKPQELSSQFAGGPRAPATAAPVAGAVPDVPEGGATAKPDEPKSAIEKELDVKADGPELPKIEDEQEDLFK